MRVLHLHDKDSGLGFHGQTPDGGRALGGLAVYVSQIVSGMRKRGVEAEAGRAIGPSDHRAEDEFRASGFWPRAETKRTLLELVERIAPDVVHIHTLSEALNSWALRSLIRRRPVVYTFHDVSPFCFKGTRLYRDGSICSRRVGVGCLTTGCHRPGSGRDILRIGLSGSKMKAYRNADVLTTPSQYMCDLMVAHGFARENIYVLPLFSRYSVRDGVPRSDGPLRILYVGRMEREKGILVLLEALARLTTNWRADLVGEGTSLEEGRILAQKLGLSARLNWTGSQSGDTLPALLSACDLFVMPSLIAESFGLAGVEAMAFGKPVVAFESGGISEWLINEESGLLVSHGSVERMASAIDRLSADQVTRVRLGAAGQRAVLDRFTLDRHLDRLLGLYDKAVEGRQKARS